MTIDWVSPRPWVGFTTHRNCHVDKIHISLLLEIKNQMRQILEIKSVIWEIKRDKFRKSKVSFEKSNDLILKIKHVLKESKAEILEIKNAVEKSNASSFGNQIPSDSENNPRGLYFSKALFEELIFGGAYIRRGLSMEGYLRFKIDWASLIVGRNLAVFASF